MAAVLIAAVYAAFIGVVLPPVLALLVSLLAVASSISGLRRRRTPLPTSTQSLTDTVAVDGLHESAANPQDFDADVAHSGILASKSR